jgi:hypothetical protein
VAKHRFGDLDYVVRDMPLATRATRRRPPTPEVNGIRRIANPKISLRQCHRVQPWPREWRRVGGGR